MSGYLVYLRLDELGDGGDDVSTQFSGREERICISTCTMYCAQVNTDYLCPRLARTYEQASNRDIYMGTTTSV